MRKLPHETLLPTAREGYVFTGVCLSREGVAYLWCQVRSEGGVSRPRPGGCLSRGVSRPWPRGCLPRGSLPGGCPGPGPGKVSAQGVSRPWPRGCLPRGSLPGGCPGPGPGVSVYSSMH